MSAHRRNRQALTVVEVLVICTVIALLLALGIPALQATRAASRRTQCKSQLRQIGIGLECYFDAQGTTQPRVFPYAAAIPSASPKQPSIRVVLAPWIEDSTAAFHCPGDARRFLKEGLSYEYHGELAGKNWSPYESVAWDFGAVHTGTRNYLYANGSIRSQ